MDKLKYPRDYLLKILPAAKKIVNPSPGQHSSNILCYNLSVLMQSNTVWGNMKQELLAVL
jgi:hypothetical protein